MKETLQQLQKLFRIRNCRDTFFANRSRPCLQHQIGRCSAPCVELISREDYAQDIAAAVKVLEGRSDEVNAELAAAMEEAAEKLQFERAAEIRDQLAALKRMQSQQIVTAEGERDVDVFAHRRRARRVRGQGDARPRRPQSRHHELFPARRARRAGRSAGLVPHAVLRAQEPPPAEMLVNLKLEEAESLARGAGGARRKHDVEVWRPVARHCRRAGWS